MGYKQLQDGDVFQVRTKDQWWRFGCCDCGLVHDFYLEIVEGDKVNMTIYRNNQATGQVRRHRKIQEE